MNYIDKYFKVKKDKRISKDPSFGLMIDGKIDDNR